MWKYVLMLLLVVIFGCEKIIEVDLNEAAPQIVIEANLSGLQGWAVVKISETTSYFSEESARNVENALVTIEDSKNNYYVLREVSPGRYKINGAEFHLGREYKLVVEVDGIKYEAKSKLHAPVKINSMTYFYSEGVAFLRSGYNIKVHFKDNPDVANFYRIKTYRDSYGQNEIYDFIIFNDRLADGREMDIVLHGKIYRTGEKATVELISIDESAYRYYVTFQELITSNPQSLTPANPTSNFSNGALGYFSAWTSSTKSIVVGE